MKTGSHVAATAWTRETRLYLSLDDLAAIIGIDAARLSVTHVDRAPDRDDMVVRVCLIETEDR